MPATLPKNPSPVVIREAALSDAKFGSTSLTNTPAQLARKLGCSADKIRALIHVGDIPHVPGFTRPFRVPKSWLEKQLAEK